MQGLVQLLLQEEQSLEAVREAYLEGQSPRNVVGPDGVPGGGRVLQGQLGAGLEEREAGGLAFKARNYMNAAAHYTAALDLLEETAGSVEATLASRLLCNRALCMMRSGPDASPRQALEDCHTALALDPSFAKARYRRACAYELLGDRSAALADALEAQRLMEEAGGQRSSDVTLLVEKLQDKTLCQSSGQLAAGERSANDTQQLASELQSESWPESVVKSLGTGGTIKAKQTAGSGW
eukprot:CAMPEP_0117651066 /NCGR_PEP_ID=MMETSP0804-20121206/1892_1 /TAXON_ID=1074897 /ORGANISM="Tetraselmis astigmatica, Strain CCMP880" /LENGTH=237 /DNA_ID=CAMNT_0005457015 /DNA_START=124 /DNA_END=835 /DNA_ORIENTATION=+